jgi:hypothetical protein
MNFIDYLRLRNKLKPKKRCELMNIFKSNPKTQEIMNNYNGCENNE